MSSRAPTLTPDLASLLWPVARREFFERYWDRRHLVSNGPATRLSGIERDLGSLDIADLAAGCKSARAWFKTSTGRLDSIPTRPGEVEQLHDVGMIVGFEDLDALEPWVRGLSRGLGAVGSGTGFVLANPAGADVPFHFDRFEVFSLQLRGRKRWELALNEHVRNPARPWAPGRPVPDTMRLYCTELPNEPPAKTTRVELRPGSVLYLPRGYWHATETIEDSLSVHLLPSDVTWGDLVIDALQTALLSKDEWREWAVGARGNRGFSLDVPVAPALDAPQGIARPSSPRSGEVAAVVAAVK